jgi:nitroimidazol reductase NimA-like FMN-containing flavoprotein (pyridoxamine 5'-phosphate oxidase superfamily)
MINEPRRSRIQTQPDYGIPADEAGMLSWNFVTARLEQARNYWLVTVRPNGRPHAVPVWGVMLDDALHFGMGRDTIKARNMAQNPNVVIHLDSSEEVVIVEGRAEEITDPALQTRLDDAYEAKYQIRHGTPVFALRPRVVFAWTMAEYPHSATRWQFEAG